MNRQVISIYAATTNNLFIYDAGTHSLQLVLAEDIRSMTGLQPFVKDAPLNLIYVANYSLMDKMSDTEKDFYSAADTGFISGNVYLFCASEGLATVVRGSLDKAALSKAMGLSTEQRIIFAQTVGFPGEEAVANAPA